MQKPGFKATAKCTTCKGKGKQKGGDKCPSCNGSGYIRLKKYLTK